MAKSQLDFIQRRTYVSEHETLAHPTYRLDKAVAAEWPTVVLSARLRARPVDHGQEAPNSQVFEVLSVRSKRRHECCRWGTVKMNERSWTFHDALRLVLLFHGGGEWGAAKQADWIRITGRNEATTKVMCDHLRSVLEGGGAFAAGSQTEHHDRLMNCMTVGHVIMQRDIDDLNAIMNDWSERVGEEANAYERGRLDTIREFGGEELANAYAAHRERENSKLVEGAMQKVRAMIDARGKLN